MAPGWPRAGVSYELVLAPAATPGAPALARGQVVVTESAPSALAPAR